MTKKDNSARRPTQLDALIGQRIRKRRLTLGISSAQLGKEIEVTQQQIQKYETGTNRVTIGRLAQIASALGCTVRFFVDGVTTTSPVARTLELTEGHIHLLRAYARIKSPDLRRHLLRKAQTEAAKHRLRTQ
jgi:transcriptional regulator with XRE-family HTH domain